jgi:undecaprenyl pyrophosphate synthase
MTNVYLMAGLILAGLLFYRYGVPRFRRFDAENVKRIIQQAQEKKDPTAHIRHALDVAAEQVEEVQEIQTGAVTHYLFEAEVFATREEAEAMRAQRIGVIARRFYEELPAALMSRGEKCSNLSARERASQRWKRTIH